MTTLTALPVTRDNLQISQRRAPAVRGGFDGQADEDDRIGRRARWPRARCFEGIRRASGQVGFTPDGTRVYEEPEGGLIVGFMAPVAVLQMTTNAEVAKFAHEVRERPQRVKVAQTTTTNPR